ncbi:UPF0764 protein C16orf89 homolog [Pectinophora gossypiella]|uniref:UPF0764 protein C16orf89 homolog n=1 Tax=Pectinophora gossypiella TaxID=13191 RepID=UPI00214E6111|nr:UPF0764 protein C16orf89 homolog [Pectinophora gossypiella]
MESLPNFNEKRLQKWILDKRKLHNYLEEMDTAELPKEKYVELVEDSFRNGFLQAEMSDTCMSRVESNIEPLSGQIKLHRCRRDSYCKKCLHSSPSVAYGVSHRMLNMIMYRFTRHCYWVSPEDDAHLIDQLCATMYREAVYIARRGYFARDLFLEHGALCLMMGYKEFYRRKWFHKALSWIDEEGCIKEFVNFEFNRTKLVISRVLDEKTKKRLLKGFKKFLKTNCDKHPMAVFTVFLANAVRYALHFLGG